MVSFQDLMKGFGVVTVMNAKIYQLKNNKTYRSGQCAHENGARGLVSGDFECSHLYLDALKISNLNQEGANKTISGGRNDSVLMQHGKTMKLEMQSALGSSDVLTHFFGCEVGAKTGSLYVTNKFPGAFAIEGDTFFIDQATGEKVKIKIFIPQFRPHGVFNLTQDAEGDAAIFDCSGSVVLTDIIDSDFPRGHEVFYLISDKSWPEGEMDPQATIKMEKITSFYNLTNYFAAYPQWSRYWIDVARNYALPAYVVTKIEDDGVYANIPDYYNGLPVVGIADDAAYNNHRLERITIGNTIEYIGAQAFSTTPKLTTVNFTANSRVHYIGRQAFDHSGTTSSLLNISLPPSVTYVDSGCFSANIPALKEYGGFFYLGDWVVGHYEAIGDPEIPKECSKIAAYALGYWDSFTIVNTDITILNQNHSCGGQYCSLGNWTWSYEATPGPDTTVPSHCAFVEYVITNEDQGSQICFYFDDNTEISYPGAFTIIDWIYSDDCYDIDPVTVAISAPHSIEDYILSMIDIPESSHINFEWNWY